MTKLKLLLIALTILSCSKEDDCNCFQENYEVNYDGEVIESIFIGRNSVDCQDEKTVYLTDTSYYEIVCK